MAVTSGDGLTGTASVTYNVIGIYWGHPVPTATALTSSANPAVTGEQVTYIATVNPNPDGGTVSFTDPGTPIAGCTAVPVDPNAGTASCKTTYSSSGSYPVQAQFSGNPPATGSQSPVLNEVVSSPGHPEPSGTHTTLRSSAERAVTGQRVNYSAMVTPTSDGGSVAFFDHGTPIAGCDAVPVRSGRAVCATYYPIPDAHEIQASYSGDPAFTSSQSPTLIQTISPSLTVRGRPSTTGYPVTITVACARSSGGCATTATLTTNHNRRTVEIGTVTETIAPATTTALTISLNQAGHELLATHHQLAVKLTVILTIANERTTIAVMNRTLKPRADHKHH